MSGREAFEKWLEVRGVFFFDEDAAWEGWSARDAELAAKDARIAELEARLCPWCDSPEHDRRRCDE